MGAIFNKEEEPAADIEIVFVVAASIAVGACLRHLVAAIQLPYTVVVLIIGVILGALERYFKLQNRSFLDRYGLFMTVNPHVLLHIFLPILIYESAFSMDIHTFMRSIWQVLVLAVPGVMLSTALLTCLCVLFFNYNWNWLQGMVFGAILSATDPVAVVALLRDLGASKQLTTLIEGESLLNDGSAIILFKVVLHVLNCRVVTTCGSTVPFLMAYFGMVVIIGPLFGYVMAKIALFCLSRIFNDAITEITITLATCYITYYIGEVFLHASGVISVVVLGVTMSGEHTSISPEVVEFLHRFWEVLVYIANTLIFVIVGMVIGDQYELIESTDRKDWVYMLALYLGLNVARAVVLSMFMPILRKLGYGLSVSEMVVVVWGGLRGAVALALALVVKHDEKLEQSYIDKVLFFVSGIVILTLIINATTIKMLLSLLGMTDIGVSRRIAMSNAINYLDQIRDKTLESLKNDRFLADASWKHVEVSTEIGNPYTSLDDKVEEDDLQLQEFRDLVDKDVVSKKEISEMGYEALLRMVKAEKYSYRRQFESGMLSAEGFHKLQECSEEAIDKKGYIDVSDIGATMEVPQGLTKLKKNMMNMLKTTVVKPTHKEDIENTQLQLFFDSLMYRIVFNMILFLSIVDTIVNLIAQLTFFDSHFAEIVNFRYYYIMHLWNNIFTTLLTFDIILRIYMRGFKFYLFGSLKKFHVWNIFKAIVMIIGVCDVLAHFLRKPKSYVYESRYLDQLLLAFKLLRCIRLILLIAALLPLMLRIVDKLINNKFRIGYDVARGFYRGKEDVIKIIDHIIDNQDIAEKIRTRAMNHQFDVIKGIGSLQRLHPAIALGIKTRQATRTVLNNLRDGISRLQEEGMLDTKEHNKLKSVIETKMKRLNLQTASIKPPPMEEVLGAISWLQSNTNLLAFIVKRASRKSFCCNDVIKEGHVQTIGIYVIVSGMVLIETRKVLGEEEEFVCDYKSSGVLGEFTFLSRKAPQEIYIADTDVQVYHLPYEAMMKMIQIFDSPECPVIHRMWMSVAIPLAEKLLHAQDRYPTMGNEDIKTMLTTHAYIADTEGLRDFDITTDMADVILVIGTVHCPENDISFSGPCYIPWTVNKLLLEGEDTDDVIVILVVPWQPNEIKSKTSSSSFGSDRMVNKRRKPNISFGALTAAINFLGATSKVVPSMSIIVEEEDKRNRKRQSNRASRAASSENLTASTHATIATSAAASTTSEVAKRLHDLQEVPSVMESAHFNV